MEARCEKFIADARRPPDARMTPKQIATLRRFLFKNQSNRFTAGEQEHLFQAVSIYVAAAPAIAAAAKAAASGGNPGGGGGGRGGDADADLDDDDDDNPVLGLLEDALKMPFTVFTTSHKKSFLKWLDKLQQQGGGGGAGGGGGGSGAGANAASSNSKPRHQLIDLTDRRAEVMDDDGETVTLDLAAVDPAMVAEMRRGFDAGLDVRVLLSFPPRPAGKGETAPPAAVAAVAVEQEGEEAAEAS